MLSKTKRQLIRCGCKYCRPGAQANNKRTVEMLLALRGGDFREGVASFVEKRR